MLASATLTRYSPAIFGISLLARMRFRAIAATTLAAVVFCAGSLALVGSSAWSFLITTLLPRLAGGTALSFAVQQDRTIAVNLAPFGLPFALERLGWESMGLDEARLISTGFTVLLLVVAVVIGRRKGPLLQRLVAWSALAALGTLRAEFSGPHIYPCILFVASLVVGEVRSKRQLWAYVLFWVMLTLPALGGPNVVVSAAGAAFRIVVTVSLLTWLAVRPAPGDPGDVSLV
jgi:hypothetical protein